MLSPRLCVVHGLRRISEPKHSPELESLPVEIDLDSARNAWGATQELCDRFQLHRL